MPLSLVTLHGTARDVELHLLWHGSCDDAPPRWIRQVQGQGFTKDLHIDFYISLTIFAALFTLLFLNCLYER